MIDMTDYKLIRAESINIKSDENLIFYDVQIEDDRTFHVFLEKTDEYLLSHNCDGSHIRALLINFFWKWFPEIILSNKLYYLNTPIVKANVNKKQKYFFTMGDFEKTKDSVSNIKYFKGLGTLNREDWKYVFSDLKSNMVLLQEDSKTDKMIDMFFGKDSQKRKKWLSV